MTRTWSSSCLGIALLIAASDVLAQNNSVTVFELRSADAPDSARVLSGVLREEYGVATQQVMLLDPLLASLQCPSQPDTTCTRRVADAVGASDFVWGAVRRAAPGQVEVELHLSSRRQPERVLRAVWPEELAPDGNRARVRQAVADLSWQRGLGEVRVFAGTVDGELYVDGASAGAIRRGDARLKLPAGSHRIEVRAQGHRAASSEVVVQPNGTVDVTIAPEPTNPERGSDPAARRKLLGYGGLGLAAAFFGAGYYSTRQIKEINEDPGYERYASFVAGPGDVCDAAKSVQTVNGAPSPSEIESMCTRGSRYEVAQWVFYGLSAVSLGTGIYLLATDPAPAAKPKSGSIRLTPSVGRQGAGIGASFAF